MAGKLVHVEINAADADRAQGFYSGVFGWEVGPPMAPEMDYRMFRTGDDQGGAIVGTDEKGPLRVYFDTDHYEEFCAEHLAELDERVLEWIKSAHFERLLFDTVRMGYPPHEHDQFLGHFHGLIDLWVRDESARLENAAR